MVLCWYFNSKFIHLTYNEDKIISFLYIYIYYNLHVYCIKKLALTSKLILISKFKWLKLGLSDCNWTKPHNDLFHKETLNHLAKLTKWLSCFVSTYLYSAIDCMSLSCHACISEWINPLCLPEYQGTLRSKQTWYLKFKWLQGDLNPQPLSL